MTDSTNKNNDKSNINKRMNKIKIDKLKLYFCEPYVIKSSDENLFNDIIIYQPTIGDILNVGEEAFYTSLNVFIANPTSYRLRLWDNGIDWNEISDFELFIMLYQGLEINTTKLLFKDINFKNYKLCQEKIDEENVKIVLYDEDTKTKIDEDTYLEISEYLRYMFNIFPKVEHASNKTAKEWIIDEERINYENHKNDKNDSNLLPLISFCLNHPGFKYKKNELREVGIVEFMDCAKRLQVYESTRALTNGMYSGMVDTSKIKHEEFNFMRPL